MAEAPEAVLPLSPLLLDDWPLCADDSFADAGDDCEDTVSPACAYLLKNGG